MRNRIITSLLATLVSVAYAFAADAQKLFCLAADENTLYAGSEDIVCLITNNGNHWEQLNINLTQYKGMVVSQLAGKGNVLFAKSGGRGSYISHDGGKTWGHVNFPESWIGDLAAVGFNNQDIYLSARGNADYFIGSVYRSVDNGATFQNLGKYLSKKFISKFAFSGNTIIAGGYDYWKKEAEAFVSTDKGASWKKAAKGLEGTDVKAMLMNGTTVFAATDAGIFSMEENDSRWNKVLVANIVALTLSGGTILAAKNNDGGIIASSDNGKIWTPANKGLEGHFVVSLAATGSTVYAIADGDLYASADKGGSWMISKAQKEFEAGAGTREIALEALRKERASLKDSLRFIINIYLAGVAEIDYSNTEVAVAKFTKALERKPDFIAALEARAAAYKKLGQAEKEKADLATLANFKASPKTDATTAALFEGELSNMRLFAQNPRAKVHYEYYYKDDRGWAEWGAYFLKKGDEEYEKRQDPTSSFEHGIECYTNTLAINSRNANYYIRRGELYVRLHRFNEGDREFYNARQIDPNATAACQAASYYPCTRCRGTRLVDLGKEKMVETGNSLFVYLEDGSQGGSSTTKKEMTTTGGIVRCGRCGGTGKLKSN